MLHDLKKTLGCARHCTFNQSEYKFKTIWYIYLHHPYSHFLKVGKITFAAVCLHNYLRVARSETYLPPAFSDWEDVEHRAVEGHWRPEGLGAMAELQPLRAHNSSTAVKELRDDLKKYFVSPTGQVPWQENYI